MLIRHSDDLTVIGTDLIEIRDPFQERSAIGLRRLRTILCERKNRDRIPG